VQFRIVLALDALPTIKLIETDLNFPNESRAAQLANVLVLLDPLRERKTIIRRELGGFGFEFLDVHGGKIPHPITTAKAKPRGLGAINETGGSIGNQCLR
jgi:hypothetical protein